MNRAPSITLIFSSIGVVKNSTAVISVDVRDPDEDPLTVTWTPTRGSITYLNAERTQVEWNVPSTVGVDSITVEVSDGTATRRIQFGIKVGSAFNGAIAPALLQKSQSPYIITVPGGTPVFSVETTTDIEAGTEILLETPGTSIDVTGSLLSHGTPAEPVVIRPNIRNVACGTGWWQGIKVSTDFPSDGFVQLDCTDLWYSQTGVRIRDQGSAVIRNCEIRCSGQHGVLHEGDATLILENTTITDSVLDGVGVVALTLLPDSVYVGRCQIAFNGRHGLTLDLNDQQVAVPIGVEYTNFEQNVEHAITLRNAVFPAIHYNRFFGNGIKNGISNIWMFSGYPAGVTVTQLDATCNFWGSAVGNPATIDATIRDSFDTGTVGTRVVFDPWLNQNPLVTPPACTVP